MGKTDDNGADALEWVGGIRNARDRREVVETFGRAFADPRWMEGHVERSLFRAPLFDPEHTRVAVADGRVVAAVTMAPRHIRFGPVTVPAATIGPVGTHDRHRKKGYASAAMEDAIAYLRESGVPVAYLQGIPDFYYRFGFYPYRAESGVKVKRASAEREAAPGRLRIMRRKDLPEVRRVYNEATRGRTCAAARDADLWDWLLRAGKNTWIFRDPKVVLDGEGRICGYLTEGKGHEPALGELVVRQTEPACRAALGALVRRAKKREEKEIEFPVPRGDALAVFIRQHVEAEWRGWSSPTGGQLMCIVDMPGLLRALAPMFTQRWRQGRTSPGAARFRLRSEIGEVGFEVGPDGVRVGEPAGGPLVRVPRRWLSGLLTGYYTPAEIAPRKGALIPTALRPALEVLFPCDWPFVYQGDNY